MKSSKRLEFVNISPEVRKAIKQYCDDKGITRANYLENDKRISNYLK
jgi:hypothetical protein